VVLKAPTLGTECDQLLGDKAWAVIVKFIDKAYKDVHQDVYLTVSSSQSITHRKANNIYILTENTLINY
jgi:hypothetical protein